MPRRNQTGSAQEVRQTVARSQAAAPAPRTAQPHRTAQTFRTRPLSDDFWALSPQPAATSHRSEIAVAPNHWRQPTLTFGEWITYGLIERIVNKD